MSHRFLGLRSFALLLILTFFQIGSAVRSIKSGKIQVSPFSTDSLVSIHVDTLRTTSIALAVRNEGEMGDYASTHGGNSGRANMNFSPPMECDTGLNSRGDATIYLFEATPMIVTRQSNVSFNAYGSMYGYSTLMPTSDGPSAYDSVTSVYQKVYGGQVLTSDSVLRMANTWYAPQHPDSDNFIIHCMQLWPASPGVSVSHVQIGELFDWDVPSDYQQDGYITIYGGAGDTSGYSEPNHLVWLRGLDAADSHVDCQNNSYRYAGSALIGILLESQRATSLINQPLYAGFTIPPESLFSTLFATPFVGNTWWNRMKNPGYSSFPLVRDLAGVLVFKGSDTGYTIPANDTLTIYTTLAVNRTAASTQAGMDSLLATVNKSVRWSTAHVFGLPSICCTGRTGDLDGNSQVNLADLSRLICHLTNGSCQLSCTASANINGSGTVDLADLSALVNYMTGGGYVLPLCPW